MSKNKTFSTEVMARSNTPPSGDYENYYQLVLNSIDDYAVFTTDKNGFVGTWNTGAEQVLGYKADEIIGKNSAIFFTAVDLEKSEDKKELRNAKKYGSAVDERYHVRKDRSIFWASGKMFPILDNQGRHIGFTKVMRNMDERRIAEEQLSQIKSYAEAIVSNSRHPILVLTNDLIIHSANNAFYQLFGLNKKATEKRSITMVGRGLFNIPVLADLLEKLADSGPVIENFEFEYEWPSIGKKFFIVNASKLRHQINCDNLLLFSIEDVTERKSLEQQKDDFISIASHEIRTPITVIKAYAQIYKKRHQM